MIFFYLLILALPLTHHHLLLQTFGEMTVIKYLGGACILPCIFRVAARQSFPPIFRTGPVVWFLLFFVSVCFSHFFHGGEFSLAPSAFTVSLSWLLLFFVTPVMVDTLSRLRWVLLVGIGSVAFASLYVIRQWQAYHTVYAGFRSWGGASGDPNYFTLTALVWLPLAFYLMMGPRPRWERLFCFGCLLVILLAVTLAASRGGFLGLMAGSLFIVSRAKRRLRNLALMSAFLMPVVFLLPSSPVQRLLNPTESDRKASESRFMFWSAGMRMFASSPLMGVGVDRFFHNLPQYMDTGDRTWITDETYAIAHNTYLQFAAEMGLLGLLPFLWLLFSTYRGLQKVARDALRSGSLLLHQAAVGMQAGLVGYAVSAFFVSGLLRTFWVLIALSVALTCLQKRGDPTQSALPSRAGA